MLDFDWDSANLEHIAAHSVSREDVEYVLHHPTLDLGYQDDHDEERFAEAGATSNGRILYIVTTWRNLRIRVVTAYDAPKSIAYEYLRKRGRP